MSAEVPSPPANKPPARSRVIRSNRRQVLLFAALTLILTVVTVWGGRVWLRNSETLIFAVGNANSIEARFAARLAAVLKNNASQLRLKIVPYADSAKALAQFDHRQADLAVLRTDAKVPARARALAILEHDVLLLLSPGTKKIKTLAELKKKKIAVVADDERSVAFVRDLLEAPDNSEAAARIQMAPANMTLDKLLAPGGFGAVIAVAHATRFLKDRSYEQYARRGVFALSALEGAKALARKNPAISEETLSTGLLSSAPAVPDEDLDSVGLQWLLVAQSRMSTATAVELARTIYENKAELALADGFASRIEPADVDKDAFIVAHQGAAQYINDETKSFMERYSDLMYFAMAALGVIGSLFAGLYTKVTRIEPENASGLVSEVMDVGERVQHTSSMEALEALQAELEDILRGAVTGLRDGAISSEGLDTFKLGYEFVRDQIAMRRESLKRHTGHDDHVVIVKSAQSA